MIFYQRHLLNDKNVENCMLHLRQHDSTPRKKQTKTTFQQYLLHLGQSEHLLLALYIWTRIFRDA